MARQRIVPIVPLIVIIVYLAVPSSGETEADILLKFRESLTNEGPLAGWNSSLPPCIGDEEKWVGLICDNGSVSGLQLHNMGLQGVIDANSLAKLPNLITASFMNNSFGGPLPNFTRLATLKTLYLSENKFNGKISSSNFFGMLGLKKLHLDNNQFTGQIPASLVALPKLMELMLENNRLEGEIPLFPEGMMKIFNVSNNLLNGQIPSSLSHLSASAFVGNRNLCGEPLESCTSPQRLSRSAIILVSILMAAALAALVAVFIILRHRKQTPEVAGDAAFCQGNAADLEKGIVAPAGSLALAKSHNSPKKSKPHVKITFLIENRDSFDMTDLLKSSAEILGSGVIGSTYKAALSSQQIMVVKRFKQMSNVNKEEFHEHMRRLGRLKHQNVLPIVGFYYRKDEKLFVTDFVERGSLASHLHGNRARGRVCLDWSTRLNIIKGVVRGLSHLYNELPSLTVPHGHLKSSNVLLDGSCTPLMTDYGLVPVFNQEHAQEHMVAYKCPEYKRSGRITKKTDVWSLGILILEILTGRVPVNFLQQVKGSDVDISGWVESVMHDEDVFDADMERDKDAEGEMMKLLKIGFDCCQADVETRLDIREALQKIEEVKEKS